jgi:hypothetical protein
MSKRIVSVFAAGSIIALILSLLPAVVMAGDATPVVTWTPRRVVERLDPGATVGVDVSVLSSETLTDVVIVATPSLRDWVTVTPSDPFTLTEGVPTIVHLEITVPDTAKGAKGGTIKVKDSSVNTISMPLNVKIKVNKQL